MAARRRTAEDKNTKLLRELACLPANKQCFDCLQRGPTYINVTIGSFVCTTCSGILRGLTPPHRVKSISMTTFSPDEIEYLKSRGNEYCKYVWLGTFDTTTNSIEIEVSDDQKKRDFMVQKYEKKRWYVDPDIAVKRMQNDQLQRQKHQITQPQNSSSRNSNLPETQPLSRLLGKSPTPLMVQNSQPVEAWPHPVSSASAHAISTKTTSQNQGSRSIDLLSELTTSSNSSTSAQVSSTSTANGNFANFANFETAFSSVEKTGWTSFDDDLDPLSSTAVSRSLTLGKESFSRVTSTYSTVMPRPLSLPTFAPTNPFKSPLVNSGSSTTPSQWSSFAAGSVTVPSSNLPMSASLDAYPPHSKQNQPDSVVQAFSPPPSVSKPSASAVATSKQSNADRYAALADLDSLFHQPNTGKAPSWSIETTSSASMFDVPVTNERTSSFSTAPSNPFTSSEMWKQPQNTKTQTSFQPVNPFQAASDNTLAFSQPTSTQVYAPFPIPMVGNSPSDENMRNQFNANFATFTSQGVTSPTNGYSTSQLLMQNGGFTSPTPNTGSWGIPSNVPHWSSSQLGQGGLFSNDNKPAETAQHADWIQNPVNPFMDHQNIDIRWHGGLAPPFRKKPAICIGMAHDATKRKVLPVLQSNSMGFPVAPRSNSSNPFL